MWHKRSKQFLCVLFLTACLLGPTEVSPQSPQGWLHARTDSVQLVLMGSCWEKDGISEQERITICRDTWYMFRDPDESEIETFQVLPGEALRVTFSLLPEDVTVLRYDGGSFERDPDLDSSRFAAPTAPGIYYYAVSAEWEPGSGMWMFKVRVGERQSIRALKSVEPVDLRMAPARHPPNVRSRKAERIGKA